MKKLYFLTLILFAMGLSAQESFTRVGEVRSMTAEAEAPFYHGVASGDPSQDGVYLWTRVTPDESIGDTVQVHWFVATDTLFENIIATGDTLTSFDRDYTVKIKVENLEPESTYYYAFQANGLNSIVGRTRTAAVDASHLRFAVASCSNYQHGYFDSYARIAERNDIDAVIHLGDYYYEYSNSDDTLNARYGIEPAHEILELMDYRTRHSFYKLDPDLMKMHQQHPIIVTWDDHEVANDSWVDGAENHNEGEGDYQERKSMSQQAYFEWMPIRDNDENSVYRSISYGDLVDLFMIDTRHHARMEQIDSLSDPNYLNPDRTILGADQKEWLLNELANSEAQWKLIGNQVLFAPVIYDQLTGGFLEDLAVQLLGDVWEGYPMERNSIIEFITENEMDNVVVLTGDIHASFAIDVPNDFSVYDPELGTGTACVELITPSISSNNYNEYFSDAISDVLVNILTTDNPHLRQLDLNNHGYYVLDVTEEGIQADWFFDPSQKEQNDEEYFAFAWGSLSEENHLTMADTFKLGKVVQEIPAPELIPNIPVVVVDTMVNDTIVEGVQNVLSSELTILSARYLESRQSVYLSWSVNEINEFDLVLTDLSGRRIYSEQMENQIGLYQKEIEVGTLSAGVYVLSLSNSKGAVVQRILVR